MLQDVPNSCDLGSSIAVTAGYPSCYTMCHNMGKVLMLKHYSPRDCPSSRSRRVSEGSMEAPFRETEKFISFGAARPYMQGLKACTSEIVSTIYLP